MHELGIATGILDIVRQYVPEERAARVRRVRVRIGEMAGVVPETLAFCFSVAVEGTAYGGASLEIELVPMTGRCKDCGAALFMSSPTFWCPDCHSPRVLLVSGREMQVEDVELDDEPADPQRAAELQRADEPRRADEPEGSSLQTRVGPSLQARPGPCGATP